MTKNGKSNRFRAGLVDSRGVPVEDRGREVAAFADPCEADAFAALLNAVDAYKPGLPVLEMLNKTVRRVKA